MNTSEFTVSGFKPRSRSSRSDKRKSHNYPKKREDRADMGKKHYYPKERKNLPRPAPKKLFFR